MTNIGPDQLASAPQFGTAHARNYDDRAPRGLVRLVYHGQIVAGEHCLVDQACVADSDGVAIGKYVLIDAHGADARAVATFQILNYEFVAATLQPRMVA